MGRLIIWNLMSVDGKFEGDQPWALDWFQHGFDEAAKAFVLEQLRGANMLVFGRKTYEGMFVHWASATGAIADLMNTHPKIVFSRTLARADWANTRIVAEDAAHSVRRLKSEVAGDIFVFGSANLSATLANANLFDEYRLGLTPVVLGGGTPLLSARVQHRELDLIEARPVNARMLLLRLAPAMATAPA